MKTINEQLAENGVVATFDLETAKGRLKMINVKNGAGRSLKDLKDGDSFIVSDVAQYRELVTTYKGDGQESIVSAFITPDGEIYSSISDPVAKVASDLIDLLGDDDFNHLSVTLHRQESKNGREFLNLNVTD